MKQDKLVSVIIPTYKRENILKRALKSIENQTYKNIEVIIIDDSPEKKSKEFFSDYKLKIIYNHSFKKRGSNCARNIGIENSSGEFISFLDDDDEWYPTKIEKQIDILSNADYALCITYSHDYRFNRDRISKPPKIVTHKQMIDSFNLSSTSTYTVPKKQLDKLKEKDGYYFDESLRSGQEYDLAIRLTKDNLEVITIQEILVTQNKSENQISENWNKKISGIMRMYAKHHQEYTVFNYIKTAGIILLFFLGYIFGTKIYNVIIPIKEIYER